MGKTLLEPSSNDGVEHRVASIAGAGVAPRRPFPDSRARRRDERCADARVRANNLTGKDPRSDTRQRQKRAFGHARG